MERGSRKRGRTTVCLGVARGVTERIVSLNIFGATQIPLFLSYPSLLARPSTTSLTGTRRWRGRSSPLSPLVSAPAAERRCLHRTTSWWGVEYRASTPRGRLSRTTIGMNAKRRKGKTASFFFSHVVQSRAFTRGPTETTRVYTYTYFNMYTQVYEQAYARVHACMQAGRQAGTWYHHIAGICLHRLRRGCATSFPFFLNFAFYLLDGIIYRRKNNEIRIIYPPRALPCALRNLLSKFFIGTFRFAP